MQNINAIFLKKIGCKCTVSVDVGGRWFEVIQDNSDTISHYVNESGIDAAVVFGQLWNNEHCSSELAQELKNKPSLPSMSDIDLFTGPDSEEQVRDYIATLERYISKMEIQNAAMEKALIGG